MTEDYNNLSAKEKKRYRQIQEEKPQWVHKQIMSKLAFERAFDDTIEKGANNPNPNDPIILKQILEGAKRWLKQIGNSINEYIDSALRKINNLIKSGIDYIEDKLTDFIGWLFNS